jgi:hypothetical protein
VVRVFLVLFWAPRPTVALYLHSKVVRVLATECTIRREAGLTLVGF